MTIRSRFVFALTCILFAAVPAFAQDSRGRILGRVTDPSGGAVAGAEVTAANAATNVTVSGRANEQGNFDIPYLLPGLYTVSAEVQGFKKYVHEGIEVRVGDRLTLNIVLEMGQMTEAITVRGETPLLEAGTASIGQVVDNRRITELPLSGGNPFVLTRLSAGVVNFSPPNHPSLAPAVEVIANIGVSGTSDHSSEFAIDGAPSMWGRNASFVPPADMVEEFKVQTSNYDAGSGHAPGGAVNVALRAGGNALHGTLSYFHNDNVLQGLDFFQRQFLYDPSTGPVNNEKRKTVAPQNVMNRYGAVFSGPVVLPKLYNGRNRTFWVYGYEGFIRPGTERGNYFQTVPTMSERQGDFSQLLSLGGRYQIYDPGTTAPAADGRYTRKPLPGNLISPSLLDPMARKLLAYWPEPNVAGSADGRNNFFRPLKSQNEYSSHTTRVDHTLSPAHRIFGRYYQSHQPFTSGQIFPNIATGNERNRYSKGFGFDDVYVVSPRFLLNFRYSFTRFIQTNSPLGLGFDLAAAGFSKALTARLDPQGVTFPQIAVDQYTQLGNTYPSGNFTNYHTWALDLTRNWGNHGLRFGGEYRLFREHNTNFNFQTPRLEFGTTWTRGPMDNSPAAPIGQGLASYLLGIPTGGQIQVNSSSANQSGYSAFFLQDDYKLSPRLTVNLGLRYEYESSPTERFNRTVRGYDFATANPYEAQARINYAKSPIQQVPADQFRATGGLAFAGVNGQPRTLWDTQKNNFAPRIGLAYTLGVKTVARAGYGIFFVPLGVDRVNVNQSGFTQRTNLVPSIDNGLSFAASLSDPFPAGFQQPAGASAGLRTDAGRSVSFFNPKLRHGYMQRWSVGVQHELPGAVAAEVTYVGNRGTRLGVSRQLDPVPAQYLSRLPVRDQATIDLLTAQVPNPFYPMLPGTDLAGRTVARGQLLRPFPQFSGLSYTDPVGYSWYHSLQVRAERRLRRGFTLQGNYTWSKFMEATSFLNAGDPMPETVISDQDRPHRFVASGIWEIPLGRGRKDALRHLLGGWQVQGVYQAQSGSPIGFGNIAFRGDVHGIVLPRGERTVYRWFNTGAGFERDPALQLGSNLRAFPSQLAGLRGPGLNIWDLSAFKNFRVGERLKLQLRSEWLNAMNHSHFAGPNTNPVNSLFGRINNTSGFPRQIYFALKVSF